MPKDKDDLKPSEFPRNLEWTDEEALTSLEKLREFVIRECNQAFRWYLSAKRGKKRYGSLYRYGAILAVAIAGAIPVLGEIYETNGVPDFSPAWAAIALIAAGVLVSIDRFAGFTSGWVRYIRTSQALSERQSDFRFEWERLRLALQKFGAEQGASARQGETTKPEDKAKPQDTSKPEDKAKPQNKAEQEEKTKWDLWREGIEICRRFSADVNSLVRAETDQWALEFQSVLKELEGKAKPK